MRVYINIISKIFLKLESSDSPFNRELMSTLKKTFIFTIIVMFLFIDTVPALFVALLLWCVYTIIDYGCTLQEEVDDTI